MTHLKEFLKELKVTEQEDNMYFELQGKKQDKSLYQMITDVPKERIDKFINQLQENLMYGYFSSENQRRELQWLYGLTKRQK